MGGGAAETHGPRMLPWVDRAGTYLYNCWYRLIRGINAHSVKSRLLPEIPLRSRSLRNVICIGWIEMRIMMVIVVVVHRPSRQGCLASNRKTKRDKKHQGIQKLRIKMKYHIESNPSPVRDPTPMLYRGTLISNHFLPPSATLLRPPELPGVGEHWA